MKSYRLSAAFSHAMKKLGFYRKPSFWLLLFLLTGCQTAVTPTPAPPAVTPSPTPRLGVDFVTRAMPTTAVIQLTSSPAPTPTPLPTATPIIYTVQAGDTLLAIAIDNQTTTEAIQELNPQVDARLLSIGQTLVLPQLTPVSIAIMEDAPIQADIVQIASYRTPTGGVWLLGEVQNKGDVPIANVQISLSLLSPSGETAVTQMVWAATAVITPNQTAPFGLLIPHPPAGEPHPVVSIIGGESVGDLGDRYLELTAVDTTLDVMTDGVGINGRLRNNGTLSVTQISLTTTFYDADGAITGYDYRVLGDEVLPQTCRTCTAVYFSFIAVPLGSNTTTFTITAQGKTG